MWFMVAPIVGCTSVSEDEKTTAEEEVEVGADVALIFVNDYIKYCNGNPSSDELLKWVSTQTSVSEAFKTEYNRRVEEAFIENGGHGLGSDPILDAQDYPEKGFALDVVVSDSGYLVVNGVEWDTFLVTMRVVSENGIWLIDGSGQVNIPQERRSRRF
jgi:hypothetical protein